jgi:Glycosyl hydrolases family 16
MRAGYVAAFALYISSFSQVVLANNNYRLSDAIVGHAFYGAFNWETKDDPTHGRVNYVDQETAINSNYSYATDNKFIMKANSRDVVQPESRGRDSVRIASKKAYDDSIMVLDIEHMPFGCGTWPAFWTLSKEGPWPHGGEIDIIEGTPPFVEIMTPPNLYP